MLFYCFCWTACVQVHAFSPLVVQAITNVADASKPDAYWRKIQVSFHVIYEYASQYTAVKRTDQLFCSVKSASYSYSFSLLQPRDI